MADRFRAIASGPIAFTHDGEQDMLPLQEIYFENGAVATDHAEADAAIAAKLLLWLQFLVKQGVLSPGAKLPSTAAPPPPKLFTINAAVAGANGNDVSVSFRSTANPAEVVIEVDAAETYDDLTVDMLEATLGKVGGAPGSRPSLVRLKSIGAVQPLDVPPKKKGTNPETWDFLDGVGGATAFTLEEWRADNLGTTTMAITNTVVTAGKTHFTLHVTWHHEVTVTLANLAKLADLKFAVTFEPEVGWSSLPALSPVELGGGDEPIAATRAHADVLARA
jgi:hypothetical protein